MKSHIRFISLLVAQSFLLQQIAFAAPSIPSSLQFSTEPKPAVHFSIPESIALIEEAYQAPTKPGRTDKQVILIQDAHTNESGQMNVAKALEYIFKGNKRGGREGDVRYIFLEAGSGDESLSFIRPRASLPSRKRVGMSFLRKGEIQGSEYFNLISDQDAVLWGVEDMELYEKALESYRIIADRGDKFEQYLDRIESTIKSLKPRIYNPSLQVFDKIYLSHLEGEMSLTVYFEKLKDLSGKHKISLKAYPHLGALNKVRAKEASIDFTLANREQVQAVTSLSAEDQKELMSLSREKHSPFRLSHEDQQGAKAYYILLEERLLNSLEGSPHAKHKALSNAFGELVKYFAYLKEARQLDVKAILLEQASLEDKIFETLARTKDESELSRTSTNLRRLKALFNLTLVPEDFDAYRSDPAAFSITEITGFLNQKIKELEKYYEKALFLEDGYEDIVKEAENFYVLTYLRDQVFLERMLQKMDAENETRAVLITGGYHTTNLKALLKSRGLSFISITPQVFHETDHKRYERLLLSQEIRGRNLDEIRRIAKGDRESLHIAQSGDRTSASSDRNTIMLTRILVRGGLPAFLDALARFQDTPDMEQGLLNLAGYLKELPSETPASEAFLQPVTASRSPKPILSDGDWKSVTRDLIKAVQQWNRKTSGQPPSIEILGEPYSMVWGSDEPGDYSENEPFLNELLSRHMDVGDGIFTNQFRLSSDMDEGVFVITHPGTRVINKIKESKVMVVIPVDNSHTALELGIHAAAKGFVPEITFRGERKAVLKALSDLREVLPNSDIAAGSVLTEEQVEDAVRAGANIIVSPGLIPDVLLKVEELNNQRKAEGEEEILVVPGVGSLAEAEQAIEFYEAPALKYFPFNLSGYTPEEMAGSFITAVSAPLPENLKKRFNRLLKEGKIEFVSQGAMQVATFTSIYEHLLSGSEEQISFNLSGVWGLNGNIDQIMQHFPDTSIIPTGGITSDKIRLLTGGDDQIIAVGLSAKTTNKIDEMRTAIDGTTGVRVRTNPIPIPDIGSFSWHPALGQTGLSLTGLKGFVLKEGRDKLTFDQILKDPHTRFTYETSIGQAFGSILFAGFANNVAKEDPKTIKNVSDANAVYLSDAAKRAYVKAHSDEALVVYADEGLRDSSAALPVGRIYYSGYEGLFQDFNFTTPDVWREFEAELSRLRNFNVRIRYAADDGLEVTNALARNKPNSWSVASTFGRLDFSIGGALDTERTYLVHDDFRIGGISYHSPIGIGLSPFDLPGEALVKIAEAHAHHQAEKIKLPATHEDYQEFIDEYVKAYIQVSVSFSRGRRDVQERKASGEPEIHKDIIQDALSLSTRFPGHAVLRPGDGDLFPRILSGLGVPRLDRSKTIDAPNGQVVVIDGKFHTFGRTGAPESIVGLVATLTDEEGRFDHAQVSPKGTKGLYNETNAFNYHDRELSRYGELGIPEEVYKQPKTREDYGLSKGAVAMTSVTGVDRSDYGPELGDLLPKIEFNQNESDAGGTAAANTFLVTPDGAVVVLRSEFATNNLKETVHRIMTLSPEAKEYVSANSASFDQAFETHGITGSRPSHKDTLTEPAKRLLELIKTIDPDVIRPGVSRDNESRFHRFEYALPNLDKAIEDFLNDHPDSMSTEVLLDFVLRVRQVSDDIHNDPLYAVFIQSIGNEGAEFIQLIGQLTQSIKNSKSQFFGSRLGGPGEKAFTAGTRASGNELAENIIHNAEAAGLEKFGLSQSVTGVPDEAKLIIRLVPGDSGPHAPPPAKQLTASGTPRLMNGVIQNLSAVDHNDLVVLTHAVDISDPEEVSNFYKAAAESGRIIGVIQPAQLKEPLVHDPNYAGLIDEANVSPLARIAADPVVLKDGKVYAENNMGTAWIDMYKQQYGPSDISGMKFVVLQLKANGLSIALSLAQEGANVLAVDTDIEALERLSRLAIELKVGDNIVYHQAGGEYADLFETGNENHPLAAPRKPTEALESFLNSTRVIIEAQEHYGQDDLDILKPYLPERFLDVMPLTLESWTNDLEVFSLAFKTNSTPNLDRLIERGVPQHQTHIGKDYVRTINQQHLQSIAGDILAAKGVTDDDLGQAFQKTPGARTNKLLTRDVKGRDAHEQGEQLIFDLIEDRRVAELSVNEKGKLELHRITIHRDSYIPGQTEPGKYRSTEDLIDIDDSKNGHHIPPDEQETIKTWLEAHRSDEGPEFTRTPRIRMILGQTAIHYKKNRLNSHYMYSNEEDNAVYIGEYFLRGLFNGTVRSEFEEDTSLKDQIFDDYLFNASPDPEGVDELHRRIDEAAKVVFALRSEDKIYELAQIYNIDIKGDTRVAFHVMPPKKLQGTQTYKNNTQALQNVRTTSGETVNAVVLPYGANVEHMHDIQEILGYIRYNSRIMGMIPAAGFKDKMVGYLDEVSTLAELLGVDPVYKDSEGKLKGEIDLGVSVVSWYKDDTRKNLKDQKIVILGSGPTGRAIAYEFIKQGAASVVITDKDEGRLEEISIIQQSLPQAKGELLHRAHAVKDLNVINDAIKEADAIFNATDLGKEPDKRGLAPDVAYTHAKEGQYWIDLNYRPKVTMFLRRVIQYGVKFGAIPRNAVLMTARVNSSHVGYFLSGTVYGQNKESNLHVTSASLNEKMKESWEKDLKTSIITDSDIRRIMKQAQSEPAWQTDGPSADHVLLAESLGFKKVPFDWEDSEGRIRKVHRLAYDDGYQAPKLMVNLSLVRTGETHASPLADKGFHIRSGDNPREETSDLTKMGIMQAQLSGQDLINKKRHKFANHQIKFIRNGMHQSNQTIHYAFQAASNSSGDVLEKKIDLRAAEADKWDGTEEKHSGFWSGYALDEIRDIQGTKEWELASAVTLGYDAFNKASNSASKSSFDPENDVMVIERIQRFIERLNREFGNTNSEVVFYGSSIFIGWLQAILEPEKFKGDFVKWDQNLPERGQLYEIKANHVTGTRITEDTAAFAGPLAEAGFTAPGARFSADAVYTLKHIQELSYNEVIDLSSFKKSAITSSDQETHRIRVRRGLAELEVRELLEVTPSPNEPGNPSYVLDTMPLSRHELQVLGRIYDHPDLYGMASDGLLTAMDYVLEYPTRAADEEMDYAESSDAMNRAASDLERVLDRLVDSGQLARVEGFSDNQQYEFAYENTDSDLDAGTRAARRQLFEIIETAGIEHFDGLTVLDDILDGHESFETISTAQSKDVINLFNSADALAPQSGQDIIDPQSVVESSMPASIRKYYQYKILNAVRARKAKLAYEVIQSALPRIPVYHRGLVELLRWMVDDEPLSHRADRKSLAIAWERYFDGRSERDVKDLVDAVTTAGGVTGIWLKSWLKLKLMRRSGKLLNEASKRVRQVIPDITGVIELSFAGRLAALRAGFSGASGNDHRREYERFIQAVDGGNIARKWVSSLLQSPDEATTRSRTGLSDVDIAGAYLDALNEDVNLLQYYLSRTHSILVPQVTEAVHRAFDDLVQGFAGEERLRILELAIAISGDEYTELKLLSDPLFERFEGAMLPVVHYVYRTGYNVRHYEMIQFVLQKVLTRSYLAKYLTREKESLANGARVKPESETARLVSDRTPQDAASADRESLKAGEENYFANIVQAHPFELNEPRRMALRREVRTQVFKLTRLENGRLQIEAVNIPKAIIDPQGLLAKLRQNNPSIQSGDMATVHMLYRSLSAKTDAAFKELEVSSDVPVLMVVPVELFTKITDDPEEVAVLIALFLAEMASSDAFVGGNTHVRFTGDAVLAEHVLNIAATRVPQARALILDPDAPLAPGTRTSHWYDAESKPPVLASDGAMAIPVLFNHSEIPHFGVMQKLSTLIARTVEFADGRIEVASIRVPVVRLWQTLSANAQADAQGISKVLQGLYNRALAWRALTKIDYGRFFQVISNMYRTLARAA